MAQIQGNIAGFNKDHQRLVYLLFADAASGRAFLADIADDIATCEEVGHFNALFKAVNERRDGAERGTVAHEDGNVRPGVNSGHEHFGFKDGISQPGIKGLTSEPPPPGQDLLDPGSFILGYETQTEAQAPPPGHVPGPGEPGYPPPAPPTPAPVPPTPPTWAVNGSYLVIRRLRQNVPAFTAFLTTESERLGIPAEVLGAKLVGRYRSGAPLELTADEPQTGFDPSTGDPSDDDPSLLTEAKINNFDYQAQDSDGHLVPRAAHIRKAYPRDQEPPGEAASNEHRILRRGIPYGPELAPGEQPYVAGAEVPPERERGLIFACYQASIAEQFEFIQAKWANTASFPQEGDGNDPIISQNEADAKFNLASHGQLTLARWVITRGGEYFFSPSVEALKSLAGSQS